MFLTSSLVSVYKELESSMFGLFLSYHVILLALNPKEASKSREFFK